MDEEIVVAPAVVYVFKKDHRDSSRRYEKSQWSIPRRDELACFQLMRARSWTHGAQGWSLHLQDDRVCYLGEAADRRRLFYARFLGAVERWHGFPADHMAHVHDIPDEAVLVSWVELEYLTPAKVRKILRQQHVRISP